MCIPGSEVSINEQVHQVYIKVNDKMDQAIKDFLPWKYTSSNVKLLK